jgi:hypothetical protein
MEMAMMKITKRKDDRREALSMNMPKIRNRPVTSSTQGKVTAKTFIKNSGRIR